MLVEITHLQAIIDDLTVLTTDPHKLPAASEQVYKHTRTHKEYTYTPEHTGTNTLTLNCVCPM